MCCCISFTEVFCTFATTPVTDSERSCCHCKRVCWPYSCIPYSGLQRGNYACKWEYSNPVGREVGCHAGKVPASFLGISLWTLWMPRIWMHVSHGCGVNVYKNSPFIWLSRLAKKQGSDWSWDEELVVDITMDGSAVAGMCCSPCKVSLVISGQWNTDIRFHAFLRDHGPLKRCWWCQSSLKS